MEYAVNHGAFHKRDHSGANDCLGVNASVFHSGHVIKIETRNSFHDQNSPSY